MTRGMSIVVVNYGTPRLLLNFLESVGRSCDLDLVREIIVVDNGYPERGDSRNSIVPAKHPFPVVLLRNREHSYASGVNRGVALASGDILVISNTDIELLPDVSLGPLVSHVLDAESDVGIAAPQLIYPDGSWQQSARRFPSMKEAALAVLMLDLVWHGFLAEMFRRGWLPDRTREVDYVDGAFMAVDPECFRATGGFDPRYSFYGEDADFCWRAAEAGWKTAFVASTQVKHIGGASSAVDRPHDYTVKLLDAKQQFVTDRSGPLTARWYGRLYRLAVLERALFYGLMARLVRVESCRQRARCAKIRWEALKDESALD